VSQGFAGVYFGRPLLPAALNFPFAVLTERAVALPREQLASQQQEIEAGRKAASERAAEAQAEADAKRAQDEAERAKKAADAQREADAEKNCRWDLKCWGNRFQVDATSHCQEQIERLAKYDFKWTDRWNPQIFSHFRWEDEKLGIITYLGDKLMFQNGFGAFANVTYECSYDTVNKMVVGVDAHEGRL
jgi:hypothetical protein